MADNLMQAAGDIPSSVPYLFLREPGNRETEKTSGHESAARELEKTVH